jgi:hypothetical protein
MISWVQDTAAGCADSCSDQLPPVIERMGFKGTQTVVRQLSYDRVTKTLRAYPVREVELLRGAWVSCRQSSVSTGSGAMQ